MGRLGNKLLLKGPLFNPFPFTDHLAPHGAKNEQAFSGVIVTLFSLAQAIPFLLLGTK